MDAIFKRILLNIGGTYAFFIYIKAWVENLNIKNCTKNLVVIMPSYFYKATKNKTWKCSVEKSISVTS